MTFSPDQLANTLKTHEVAPGYWVAFSGGLDSHVLLHALAAARENLAADIGAVHVHHGLQQAANDWELHCAAVCEALGVRFEVLRVNAAASDGASPEAAAREARYAALESWLPSGHFLLTAHHQDDQAETLLLQLLRGSGVNGLAAMPASTVLGKGRLLRPLLGYPRDELRQYADEQGLDWIEDPSNTDTGFDRNYLRHQVLPVLKQRWPSAAAALARSAGHCAETADLMQQLAMQDSGMPADVDLQTLSMQRVAELSPPRQRNLLRYWIHQAGGQTPSTAVLARIRHDMLQSREDAEPCVRWGNCEVRRYRDMLYLLEQSADATEPRELHWMLDEPLSLPGSCGVLHVSETTGQGIRLSVARQEGAKVGWRRGGERCHPVGRANRHSLKKLFQERGVPPWERPHIPLIYIGGELAAVADLWVCEPFQAGPQEAGLMIDWKKPDPVVYRGNCPSG